MSLRTLPQTISESHFQLLCSQNKLDLNITEAPDFIQITGTKTLKPRFKREQYHLNVEFIPNFNNHQQLVNTLQSLSPLAFIENTSSTLSLTTTNANSFLKVIHSLAAELDLSISDIKHIRNETLCLEPSLLNTPSEVFEEIEHLIKCQKEADYDLTTFPELAQIFSEPAKKSTFSYLLGQEFMRSNRYEEALTEFSKIASTSKHYNDALIDQAYSLIKSTTTKDLSNEQERALETQAIDTAHSLLTLHERRTNPNFKQKGVDTERTSSPSPKTTVKTLIRRSLLCLLKARGEAIMKCQHSTGKNATTAATSSSMFSKTPTVQEGTVARNCDDPVVTQFAKV